MGGLCQERCEEGRRGGRLDRRGWKRQSDEAVKKLQTCSTSPLKKGKEEERDDY